MHIKKYDYFFISAGAEKKMYTLCAAYQHVELDGTFIRNSIGYVRNLSNNRDTAIEKALTYASTQGRELRLDVDLFELNDFEYGKEPKATRAEIKAQKAKDKEEELERDYNVRLTAGLMQIGKYTGMTASEVHAINPEYINYAVKQTPSVHSHFAVNVELCKQFKESNPSLFIEKEDTKGHIGKLDDKVDVTLTIKQYRWVDGFAYNTKQLYIVGETLEGDVVEVYTTNNGVTSKDVGDTITLTNATVKKHNYQYPNKTKSTILGGRFKVVA